MYLVTGMHAAMLYTWVHQTRRSYPIERVVIQRASGNTPMERISNYVRDSLWIFVGYYVLRLPVCTTTVEESLS